MRTTQYSKSLYDGLEDESLENWKDIIKLQQNWIGKCNGTNITFEVEDSTSYVIAWTDKPEMIHGTAFIGLSPGHILDQQENVLQGEF